MFKAIVTAIDGSTHAQNAADLAARLAVENGASLLFVHVAGHGPVPAALAHMAEVEHLAEPSRASPENVANVVGGLASAQGGPGSRAYADRVRLAVGDTLLDAARNRARRLGVSEVEVELVESGDPASAIVAAARQRDADLIVVGGRGLSDLKGLLLGSVSHRVCQFAACPCLTVK